METKETVKEQSFLQKVRGFQSVFWIVQIFELMERGAYYTFVPIIVYYAQYNLGVPVWIAVNITIFMYPIQYGLPILSGALAEKWGYKKQMFFAYTVLFFAYLFLSFASGPLTLILGVMMIGFGIGSYKPLISATIAKSTHQDQRNMAYSIYYWFVNLAAAVFPMIYVALETMKLFSPSMYAWVFRIGAFFFLINLVILLTVFKEVPRSGNVRTVKDVRNNIAIAFRDKKFLAMVFLIAGFWALYSSMLNALPSALFNFKMVPSWFGVMILAIPNPLTIILAGPYLAKKVEKLESLVAVMMGVLLYVIGLAFIGYFGLSLNWTFVIIGIVISSVGEFLVAPGYYAFVSKLAPKEKVSAYLGTNFLSSMSGLWLGTLVFGVLYTIIGTQFGRPKLFYGILVALGFLLLLGFMTYYKSWGQDVIERANRIKAMEEGEEAAARDKASKQGYPMIEKVFTFKATPFLVAILIPISIVAGFMMGTDTYYPPEEEGSSEEPTVVWEYLSQTYSLSDRTNEGQESSVPIRVAGESVNYINVSLTWTDESVRPGLRNMPDSFEIELLPPNSSTPVDSAGPISSGNLQISYHPSEEGPSETGEWTVVVRCTDAGDITGLVGILVRQSDTGNEWSLSAKAEYLSKADG